MPNDPETADALVCRLCGEQGRHGTVADCLTGLREQVHAERILRVLAEQERDALRRQTAA